MSYFLINTVRDRTKVLGHRLLVKADVHHPEGWNPEEDCKKESKKPNDDGAGKSDDQKIEKDSKKRKRHFQASDLDEIISVSDLEDEERLKKKKKLE